MKQLSLGSIYHMPWLEYRHTTPEGDVVLRLRTGKGEWARVAARVADPYAFPDPFATASEYDMTVAYRDDLYDFYEVRFHWNDPRM